MVCDVLPCATDFSFFGDLLHVAINSVYTHWLFTVPHCHLWFRERSEIQVAKLRRTLRYHELQNAHWASRATSGKHSLSELSLGFLQATLPGFSDAFYPLNVHCRAGVGIFDPLEVVQRNLVVLLASPSSKLLAHYVVHGVVETLCRVLSKHSLPKELLLLVCKGVCSTWLITFAFFSQFNGFPIQYLTTLFKLSVTLYAEAFSPLSKKSIQGCQHGPERARLIVLTILLCSTRIEMLQDFIELILRYLL